MTTKSRLRSTALSTDWVEDLALILMGTSPLVILLVYVWMN